VYVVVLLYFFLCVRSGSVLTTPNVCTKLDGLKAVDKFIVWVNILGLP